MIDPFSIPSLSTVPHSPPNSAPQVLFFSKQARRSTYLTGISGFDSSRGAPRIGLRCFSSNGARFKRLFEAVQLV